MKGKIRVLFVLVLAAVLLAALVPAADLAEGNKTCFSGTDCFVAPLAEVTETPLGNGAVRVEGSQQQYRSETDDPRTGGDSYIGVSMILDMNTGSGPLWGTFEMVNDQGGWSGHWVGHLDNWANSIHGVAHGSGAYGGMVGYWTSSRPGPWTCFVLEGYIVETGVGE